MPVDHLRWHTMKTLRVLPHGGGARLSLHSRSAAQVARGTTGVPGAPGAHVAKRRDPAHYATVTAEPGRRTSPQVDEPLGESHQGDEPPAQPPSG